MCRGSEVWRSGCRPRAGQEVEGTHVERVVAVAAGRTEREHLGPLVRSVNLRWCGGVSALLPMKPTRATDLEVGVRVLLFQHELHGLLNVHQKLAGLVRRLVLESEVSYQLCMDQGECWTDRATCAGSSYCSGPDRTCCAVARSSETLPSAEQRSLSSSRETNLQPQESTYSTEGPGLGPPLRARIQDTRVLLAAVLHRRPRILDVALGLAEDGASRRAHRRLPVGWPDVWLRRRDRDRMKVDNAFRHGCGSFLSENVVAVCCGGKGGCGGLREFLRVSANEPPGRADDVSRGF